MVQTSLDTVLAEGVPTGGGHRLMKQPLKYLLGDNSKSKARKYNLTQLRIYGLM